MKFHKIDMVGPYYIQEESTKPSHGSSDDRRFIKVDDTQKLYYATDEKWVELSTRTDIVGEDLGVHLREFEENLYGLDFLAIDDFSDRENGLIDDLNSNGSYDEDSFDRDFYDLDYNEYMQTVNMFYQGLSLGCVGQSRILMTVKSSGFDATITADNSNWDSVKWCPASVYSKSKDICGNSGPYETAWWFTEGVGSTAYDNNRLGRDLVISTESIWSSAGGPFGHACLSPSGSSDYISSSTASLVGSAGALYLNGEEKLHVSVLLKTTDCTSKTIFEKEECIKISFNAVDQVVVGIWDGSSYDEFNTTTTWTDGRWKRLDVSIDLSQSLADRCYIYFDGSVQSKSNPVSTSSSFTDSGGEFVIANNVAKTAGCVGDISDFFISIGDNFTSEEINNRMMKLASSYIIDFEDDGTDLRYKVTSTSDITEIYCFSVESAVGNSFNTEYSNYWHESYVGTDLTGYTQITPSHPFIANTKRLMVFVNGVYQRSGIDDDYYINDGVIIFNSSLNPTDTLDLFYYGGYQIWKEAETVSYNHPTNQLSSTNVQDVIDEIYSDYLEEFDTTVSVVTTAGNFESNKRYIVDTSSGSYTVNLPSSPDEGTFVEISPGSDFTVNNLTVGRNGEKIVGSSTDLIINLNKGVKLRYYNSTYGWGLIGG